jgi:hypothetical protein
MPGHGKDKQAKNKNKGRLSGFHVKSLKSAFLPRIGLTTKSALRRASAL